MSKASLFRLSGLSGVIGAILYVLGWWIHPPTESVSVILGSSWVPAHGLTAIGCAFLLLCLTGIYLKKHERVGVLGLVGFILTFAGLMNFFGINMVAAIVEPAIAMKLGQNVETAAAGPLLTAFFLWTIISYVVGGILFGVTSLRSMLFPKLATLLLIIGAAPLIAFLVEDVTVPFIVYRLAATMFAVGFGWLGYHLMREEVQVGMAGAK